MKRIRRASSASAASLATLCLPPDATPQDVRRAYRSLMLQLHPDASGNTGSHDQMAAVVAAYRELAAAGFLDERRTGNARHNGQLVDTRV
jgi:DnaJ-domain-containing protein 1